MNGAVVIPVPGGLGPLSGLLPGDEATIDRLGGHPDTMLHLLELGLAPGERIRFLRTAPGGDPLEFEIMGYRLAIRRAEADAIIVRRLDGDADAG